MIGRGIVRQRWLVEPLPLFHPTMSVIGRAQAQIYLCAFSWAPGPLGWLDFASPDPYWPREALRPE